MTRDDQESACIFCEFSVYHPDDRRLVLQIPTHDLHMLDLTITAQMVQGRLERLCVHEATDTPTAAEEPCLNHCWSTGQPFYQIFENERNTR